MSPRYTRWLFAPLVVASGGCSVVGYPAPTPPPAPVVVGGGEPEPAPERPSRYGNPETYEVFGEVYRVLPSAVGYQEEGWASWYGEEFAGRPTSSGEIFDPDRMSAAHRTLPLPTWVEVTNLENGRSVTIRVNDRGPFAQPERRIIDVSRAAARRLGLIGPGTARVRVRALTAEELAAGGPGGPAGGR